MLINLEHHHCWLLIMFLLCFHVIIIDYLGQLRGLESRPYQSFCIFPAWIQILSQKVTIHVIPIKTQNSDHHLENEKCDLKINKAPFSSFLRPSSQSLTIDCMSFAQQIRNFKLKCNSGYQARAIAQQTGVLPGMGQPRFDLQPNIWSLNATRRDLSREPEVILPGTTPKNKGSSSFLP